MTAAGNTLSGPFAIVGLGVINGVDLGMTSRTLQAEAARLAIEDAGLRRQDIDGAINGIIAGGSMPAGGGWVDGFTRVLGVPAGFYWTVARGSTAAHIGILAATRALELGLANYVVLACGEARWTRSHHGSRERRGRVGNTHLGVDLLGFTAGAASSHAFLASRYMAEYGATSRQFGAVAVASRQWANLNPEAQMYGRPITIEDHQASRWIVEPLHLLDCCLNSDASVAVIITTRERAQALKQPPVYIMGLGFGDHARSLWWDKANYTRFDVAPAKAAAFGQAGVTVDDIDVAHLYDAFTPEVVIQLEDYGWCEKGEGGAFVEAGRIAPGGSLPFNTGGGLHSGFYLGDYTGLSEIVRQLRGECGARQVSGAEVGMVTGLGGELLSPGVCATHAVSVLAR